MHESLDNRLRRYRDDVMSTPVPARTLRPSRRRIVGNVSGISIFSVLSIFVAAGAAAATGYLIPMSAMQRELARALGTATGAPVTVIRYAPADRLEDLHSLQMTSALKKLRRISHVESVEQSSSGRDVTVRGALEGHHYVVALSVVTRNANVARSMTFVDAGGRTTRAWVPFAGKTFDGTLFELDVMPRALRDTLIAAIDKSAKIERII